MKEGTTRTVRLAGERPLRHLDGIRDPVALATKYLASRGLLGGRDQDDLMDAAIEAIVNAALSWDPNGGKSILSWVWMYMERDVQREINRGFKRRYELGLTHCFGDEEDDPASSLHPHSEQGNHTYDQDPERWLNYHNNTDWFSRVEMRVDLQRLADLAELSDAQRFIVEYAAQHQGVYVRDTPLADRTSPLRGSGNGVLKNALKHMRQAAATNERRDDRWTRMRANGNAGHLERKQAEALRKWREELDRPLVEPRETTRQQCAEEGCDRLAESWGLCDRDYRRARRDAAQQLAS